MDHETGGAPLRLPTALNLAAAEEFLASMQQHAQGEMPLRVDASAVEILTLPCVQILLAAARDHGRICVANPSAAFLGAFEEFGIDGAEFMDRVDTDSGEEFSGEVPRSNPASDNFQQAALYTSADPEQSPSLATEGSDQGQPGDDGTAPDADDMTAPGETIQPISEYTMGKRIMTIDDSKTMRDMLMLTLAEAGFDVLQAVDGQDGIDKLVNERVDVVITDINMPKMDGYEVIRQLRRDPAHRTTPILVLTTESEAEKRDLARNAGATGWMVKPFDPDRLVATVRKVAP